MQAYSARLGVTTSSSSFYFVSDTTYGTSHDTIKPKPGNPAKKIGRNPDPSPEGKGKTNTRPGRSEKKENLKVKNSEPRKSEQARKPEKKREHSGSPVKKESRGGARPESLSRSRTARARLAEGKQMLTEVRSVRHRDIEYGDKHRDKEYGDKHRDKEYTDKHRDKEYDDKHRGIEYTDTHRDNARAELKVQARFEAKEELTLDSRRMEEGRAAAGCETAKGCTQNAVERKHGVQQLKVITKKCSIV